MFSVTGVCPPYKPQPGRGPQAAATLVMLERAVKVRTARQAFRLFDLSYTEAGFERG